MKKLNAVGALLKKRCSSREKLEGWWVISPYFARENKSEKCHQLLELFIYHVCDEEKKNPTSLRRKKTGKTTEETYKRDVKLFQLRRLALNKKGTQLSLQNKRKLMNFTFIILHVLEYAHSF